MSRFLKVGGMTIFMAVAAIVVGVTTPTDGAYALQVNPSISNNGSIPADDATTQTFTLVVELDHPESEVTQARIQVNCGINVHLCGVLGWSPVWGFQEPIPSYGFGNEHIRLLRDLSSYQLSQTIDGRPIATISYVFTMRSTGGTVGINTISYMVRDRSEERRVGKECR